MKIHTQSLIGKPLDWAVGRAEGGDLAPVEYSTDWAFGGLIIDRELISILLARAAEGGDPALWYAAKHRHALTGRPLSWRRCGVLFCRSWAVRWMCPMSLSGRDR